MENEILYRYLKGETTAKEELEIAAWLEADPESNQKQLDSVRFVFEGVELYGQDVAAVTHRAKRLSWRSVRRYAIQAAAVVLVAFGAGYVVHQKAVNNVEGQTNTIYVPAGQRMELTLGDGTHVWLNSEASIEYPAVFARDSRWVRLSGEAMFDVKHDNNKPFTVETFASRVRVLGTKFNVNADQEHQTFSTALLEGSVLVANLLNPDQENIVLKPNQVVTMVAGQLQTKQLEDRSSLCWTDGMLYITGLSFAELMDKLEQTFAVRIVIERESLPDMKNAGGKIRVNTGIENVLRVLQYAADFSYTIDEATNTITIR